MARSAWLSAPHWAIDMEAGDPLAGVLAAQHAHVVLHPFHLTALGLEDRPVELRVANRGAHGAAADHQDLAVFERLGAEAVIRTRLQPGF